LGLLSRVFSLLFIRPRTGLTVTALVCPLTRNRFFSPSYHSLFRLRFNRFRRFPPLLKRNHPRPLLPPPPFPTPESTSPSVRRSFGGYNFLRTSNKWLGLSMTGYIAPALPLCQQQTCAIVLIPQISMVVPFPPLQSTIVNLWVSPFCPDLTQAPFSTPLSLFPHHLKRVITRIRPPVLPASFYFQRRSTGQSTAPPQRCQTKIHKSPLMNPAPPSTKESNREGLPCPVITNSDRNPPWTNQHFPPPSLITTLPKTFPVHLKLNEWAIVSKFRSAHDRSHLVLFLTQRHSRLFTLGDLFSARMFGFPPRRLKGPHSDFLLGPIFDLHL